MTGEGASKCKEPCISPVDFAFLAERVMTICVQEEEKIRTVKELSETRIDQLSTEVRERMELRFKEFAEFQESHFSKLADTESRLIEIIEKLEKRTTDMEG